MNIAPGHFTSQSSMADSLAIGLNMSASLAVDANTDTNVAHGSCMVSAKTDANPWMAVDLGKPSIVTSVRVTNGNQTASKCGEFIYTMVTTAR